MIQLEEMYPLKSGSNASVDKQDQLRRIPVTSAYCQKRSMAVPHSTVLEMWMAHVGRLKALVGSAWI